MMWVKILLPIVCLITYVQTTRKVGNLADAIANDGKSIQITGPTFHRRYHYPTLEEACALPLQVLVTFRRSGSSKAEGAYYRHLFASHPSVTELLSLNPSTTDFVQGWVDLWCNNSAEDAKCKTLYFSIMDYIANNKAIPSEIQSEIMQRHHKIVNAARQRRQRERRKYSHRAEDIEKYKDELAKFAKYRQVRKGYTEEQLMEMSGAKFRDLLLSENIPLDMPTAQLEKATRYLRDALGGTQRTTISFKHFLMCRKDAWTERDLIDRTVQTRRETNRRQTKQKNYHTRRAHEKEAEVKELSRLKSSTGSCQAFDRENRTVVDEQLELPSHSRLLLSLVLASSKWWKV